MKVCASPFDFNKFLKALRRKVQNFTYHLEANSVAGTLQEFCFHQTGSALSGMVQRLAVEDECQGLDVEIGMASEDGEKISIYDKRGLV
jgi:hypothetical protein